MRSRPLSSKQGGGGRRCGQASHCLTSRSSAAILRGMASAEVTRVVEQHRRFWKMEAVGAADPPRAAAPAAGFRRALGTLHALAQGGRLDRSRRASFEPVLADEPAALLDGCFFNGFQLPGLCWTEALLGCPVRMETGGAWAETFLGNREQVTERCRSGGPADDDPWLTRFRQGTALLAERAGGRFPVIQPLMRGPLDMMAAALGHEAMATAFHDDPGLARELLTLCTDIFLALAWQHVGLAPGFLGGDVTFGLWAPGRAIRTQLDNAVLLSPRLYRDCFLPHDSRVFDCFDLVVIHVHSGCLHIVDALLSAPSWTRSR